jgi:hypothetical protein
MSNGKDYKLEEIYGEIDMLHYYFSSSKAFFRYIRDIDLGQEEIPPYNVLGLYEVQVKFNRAITKEDQNFQNAIGHYLNQNFLIRLYCLLEAHHIIDKDHPLNENLSGGKEVSILEQMRHRFSHGSGKINYNVRSNVELLESLINYFGEKHVDKENFPISQYPTIKKVIDGAKLYVKAVLFSSETQ